MSQPATSSGSIAVTAGAAVIPAATRTSQVYSGIFYALTVSGGSAAGTATVYDGTSTSGVVIAQLSGVAIGTSQTFNISNGCAFANGLFIVVSGTASTALVHYLID